MPSQCPASWKNSTATTKASSRRPMVRNDRANSSSEKARQPRLAHGDSGFSLVIRQNDAARYLASSPASGAAGPPAGGAGSGARASSLGAGGAASGALTSLMTGSRRDEVVRRLRTRETATPPHRSFSSFTPMHQSHFLPRR